MALKRSEFVELIHNQLRRIYNTADPRQPFDVDAGVVTKILARIKERNDFLNKINVTTVSQIAGKTLGFGVPSLLMKRTTSKQDNGFNYRRPSDPFSLGATDYKCLPSESDPLLTWEKLDNFAHLPNFYELYRDEIDLIRAADTVRVGWWGQYAAPNTDPIANPMGQDIHIGWLQHLINVAPDQVMGLNKDGSIDTIRIGNRADADFKSLDQAVNELRQVHLNKYFRNSQQLRVMVGHELSAHERAMYFGEVKDPSEINARDLMLAQLRFGEVAIERVDDTPDRLLYLSPLNNISHYTQVDTVRRQVVDSHEHKGIVDYLHANTCYVNEHAEGAAALHPDAVALWDDEANDWVKSEDVWKVTIPAPAPAP